MLVQRGGRIFSILGVCSFLAARFCYRYIIFYYGWAKPQLIVLLSKIMGGDCDAMILDAAQAILWPTRIFGVCSGCLFVLTRFTYGNRGKFHMSWFQLARADCDAMILAAAQATFWPTRVFGVCSGCLFVLTRVTCGNRGKFHVLVSTCACPRG